MILAPLADIIRLSTTDPWHVTANLIISRSIVALVLVSWVIDMTRSGWSLAPWRVRTVTWPWALTLFLVALILAFTAGIARSLLVGHIIEFNRIGEALRNWEMFTSDLMAVTAIAAYWRWRNPTRQVDRAGVFAKLFAALPAIVTDHTGVILEATDRLHDLGGYAPGSLLGQPLTVIMPERYRQPHRAGLHRYLLTGVKVVLDRDDMTPLHLLRADGSELPIWLTLTHADVGGKPWFLGEIRPRLPP